MTLERSAAGLLRAVGLLPDGPVVWGRPVPPTNAGVFVIELAEPRPSAPIELARGREVGRARARAASRRGAADLEGAWPPGWRRSGSRREPVLYIGTSEHSVSRRVAAIGATALGDRRPYSGGHWLHALQMPAGARDLVGRDAGRRGVRGRAARRVRRRGRRRGAGGPARPGRGPAVREPAPGDRRAQGDRPDRIAAARAGGSPATADPRRRPARWRRRGRGRLPCPEARTGAREGRDGAPAGRASAAAGGGGRGGTPTPEVAPPVEGALTVEGAARLRAELETLTKVKRPEVIARIRAAKELGDLKENADYSSAREEQSFLGGSGPGLEARLRTAVIVDAPAAGARIGLGSAVSVRIDGEDEVLTIVGSSESDPATGRISSASPVGRALLGREAGDDVVVSTPAGAQIYRSSRVD